MVHEMRSRALVVAGRLAVRLVPAALLLWGGLAKAFDRQASILAVDAYDVLPADLVRPVAAVLPWVEIALAALLVLGLFVRFAGVATAALGTVFIAGMAQAKARGLDIDCGCFGGGGVGEGVGWWDIVRDAVFVVAPGIYLAIRPRGPLQLDNRFFDLEGDDGQHREADQALASARAG
jgi:uncharacterized membrane protein YphA (DoxX/SURF4 family)